MRCSGYGPWAWAKNWNTPVLIDSTAKGPSPLGTWRTHIVKKGRCASSTTNGCGNGARPGYQLTNSNRPAISWPSSFVDQNYRGTADFMARFTATMAMMISTRAVAA